jgi:endoglycosylceramidase
VAPALAIAAIVLALAPAASRADAAPRGGASAFLPRAPLHPDGRWIKDATGRTIIIHGLELARKTPPYYAPVESFADRDGGALERWGFDAVRLGWFWKGLEPRRGRVDRGYVAELAREGMVLARHHILTLLEAHQDGYNEAVGGAGFPDWATSGAAGGGGAAGGLLDMAAWKSFANLYANGDGVASAFAHAWMVMASAFRRNALMLGYDLLNEPSPGSQSLTCLQAEGCPNFDRSNLQPLEDRLAAAIRTADPTTIVFYEPDIYFDVGAPSWLQHPLRASGASGFAFHDYCLFGLLGPPDHESQAPGYPGCEARDEHVFANALATASAMAVPPLFDEFGDTQDLTDIERMTQLADSNLTGWIYWSYKDWADYPGGLGSGPLFDDSDDDGTLRKAKLTVLSQPYPIATAGMPLTERYDPTDDTFSYTYAPNRRISKPTVIFTAPLHHPHGYTAAVSGARVVSAPNARYLVLRPVSHGNTVRVHLTPAVARAVSRATTHRARITLRCTAACFSALSPAWMHSTESADSLGTASGSCDDNADSPAGVTSPTFAAAPTDVIAHVQVHGAAGEVTARNGISVAYNSGDSAWADLGTVPPGGAARATVICRLGAASYTFTFFTTPLLPTGFSGSSTHDTNVSLANSRLAFLVPTTGRYTAHVTVTRGTIELGPRRNDGSTPPARTFSASGTEDLGILRHGIASLDVTALPGAQARWTILIRAAPGPA